MEMDMLIRILETVEGLDSKFVGLDAKVDRLDVKVDGLYAKVDGLDVKVDKLDLRVDGLETKVNGLNLKVDLLQKTVRVNEVSQHDDILSVLEYINVKLDDTAKKSDIEGLRKDIEYAVKENSLFKLELDRLRRNGYE